MIKSLATFLFRSLYSQEPCAPEVYAMWVKNIWYFQYSYAFSFDKIINILKHWNVFENNFKLFCLRNVIIKIIKTFFFYINWTNKKKNNSRYCLYGLSVEIFELQQYLWRISKWYQSFFFWMSIVKSLVCFILTITLPNRWNELNDIWIMH